MRERFGTGQGGEDGDAAGGCTHAHARSYFWFCVASAANAIGHEGAKTLADAAFKTRSSLKRIRLEGAYHPGGRGGK